MEERPGTERGSHRRPRGRARTDGASAATPESVVEAGAALDPEAAAATGQTEQLEPLDVDGVVPVLVITMLWGVASVVLLFMRDDLAADNRTWWLWTCVAGFGFGLLGFAFVRRRRDARRAAGGRP